MFIQTKSVTFPNRKTVRNKRNRHLFFQIKLVVSKSQTLLRRVTPTPKAVGIYIILHVLHY